MSRVARWFFAVGIAGVGLAACSGGLENLSSSPKDASAGSGGGSAGHDAGTGGSSGLGGSGATGGGGSSGAAGTGGAGGTAGTGGTGGTAGATTGGTGGTATGGSGGTAGGGTGGSAATGGSGGSGAAGGTGPGQVLCGSSICNVMTQSCCLQFHNASCGPTGACSPGNRIECDGPEDCPSGESCCAVLNGPGTLVRHIECKSQCASSDAQICGGNAASCPNGQLCKPFALLQGYTHCD